MAYRDSSPRNYPQDDLTTDTLSRKATSKSIVPKTSTYPVGPMVILERPKKTINLDRAIHTVKLLFNPNLTKAFRNLDTFTDLSVPDLQRCVRGLIINVNNTLGEPNTQEFSPEIIAKLEEIKHALRVCFYSDDNDHRPQLAKTGISFARNIAAKPDPNGYEMAACLKLNLKSEDVGVVGSDYTMDSTCKEIGMRYIHVKPISGPNEPFSEKLIRGYGNMVASIHDRFRKQ